MHSDGPWAYMRHILRANATDTFPGHSHARSLQTGVERFAKWRWKTLATVCARLKKLAPGITAFAEVAQEPESLGVRDIESATAFLRISSDADFWGRAEALRRLTGPMNRFSSWARGCPCHEAELARGRKADCPWKGCRAVELSQRIAQLMAELAKLREEVTEGDYSGASVEDFRTAISRQMSFAALKFAWVDEPPYLLWQAPALAMKKMFALRV